MRRIRVLMKDRKRSQRGSVLSAVLIIVAFLGIIAGALMTELSTNFLLSRTLVNRVGNEATVNSAVELALDRFQSSPLASGCPTLGPVNLNGRTAAVSYVSCAPVVDKLSPQFTSLAPPSAPFSIDGTHSVIPGSQDLYLVGDSQGTIYQIPFGQTSAKWSLDLGSAITGPPLAMQDPSGSTPDPTDISNLVPIAGGDESGCLANACVVLLPQDTDRPGPDSPCFMAANAAVTSRPAAGVASPKLAYFGDGGGTLFAYNATEFGNCALMGSQPTTGNAAVVAGPVVFGHGSVDEIYVVTAKGVTSRLDRFSYDQSESELSLTESLLLPFANPVGLAVEKTTVAAGLAVTFAGGQVAMVNISGSYHPTLLGSTGLGTTITDAPSWCSCPGGQEIGVAGLNGTLYVLDTNLALVASYASGSPIHTTPSSDGVGEWFFGADDGLLHEVQLLAGQSTLAAIRTYGQPWGAVRSAVQVGACPAGICAYVGSLDSNAYLVSLDARDAVLTACLSSPLPACAPGVDPRLWANVEVGSVNNQRTVRVTGWSYYSP